MFLKSKKHRKIRLLDFKTLSDRTTRTALTCICEWYLVECSPRGWVAGSNPVRVEQILSESLGSNWFFLKKSWTRKVGTAYYNLNTLVRYL